MPRAALSFFFRFEIMISFEIMKMTTEKIYSLLFCTDIFENRYKKVRQDIQSTAIVAHQMHFSFLFSHEIVKQSFSLKYLADNNEACEDGNRASNFQKKFPSK